MLAGIDGITPVREARSPWTNCPEQLQLPEFYAAKPPARTERALKQLLHHFSIEH
jgi:hypothetical protein